MVQPRQLLSVSDELAEAGIFLVVGELEIVTVVAHLTETFPGAMFFHYDDTTTRMVLIQRTRYELTMTDMTRTYRRILKLVVIIYGPILLDDLVKQDSA